MPKSQKEDELEKIWTSYAEAVRPLYAGKMVAPKENRPEIDRLWFEAVYAARAVSEKYKDENKVSGWL